MGRFYGALVLVGVLAGCETSGSAAPVCGDGVVEGTEGCDDGVLNSDTAACLSSCVVASCGDGFVQEGAEGCDDGDTVSNGEGECLADCSGVQSCGDGTKEGTEGCDDGNDIPTDACLNNCIAATCGDGFVQTGVEGCDDGDEDNTDGCLNSCMVAKCGDGFVRSGVEGCDDGALNSDTVADACRVSCVAASCGDGTLDTGEGCDDGNGSNEDACLNSCVEASCGDGVVDSGEACDTGALNSDSAADSCRTTCVAASCGDGTVDTGEACDTGGANSDTVADACRTSCAVSSCGDGAVDTGEVCDDGNSSNLDGCLNSCTVASCGDGFVQADVEACDDRNSVNTDACLNSCLVASCGDGFVRLGLEECDDGNQDDSDSCLTTCLCRSGYTSVDGVCVDDDECVLGTDTCDSNATCSNPPGSFTCACNSGYFGDGTTCTDIDECAGISCGPGGTCSEADGEPSPGKYTCSCASGYEGGGVKTVCAPVLCGVNQYVLSHACVDCVAGTYNLGGDEASGEDTACAKDAELESFEIGAYLPYWGIDSYTEYAYENLTSLYILATLSEASVKDSKGLIFGDNDASETAYDQPELSEMMAYIREANPTIKIFLSLSDLHNDHEQRTDTATLFTEENLENTVEYIMTEYVDRYDFDGVDIDFEDDTLKLEFIGKNYGKLIKDLADALHNRSARGREKLLFATLNSGDYKLPAISSTDFDNVDGLGFMDYGSDKIDHIVANPNRDLKIGAANWAQYLDKNKITLGVAGWSVYIDGAGKHVGDAPYSWHQLLDLDPSNLWYVPYLTSYQYTPEPDCPPVWWADVSMQQYNSLYEIRRKAEWAKSEGYRGLFLWDLTKDAHGDYAEYSQMKLLRRWKDDSAQFDPIVGYTTQDYYIENQEIEVGFHSLDPSDVNWVGVYKFDEETSHATSTGHYQYLPNSASGTVTIPSSLTQRLTPNKLYILKFYRGASGIGEAILGTSHPFYRM